MKYWIVFIVSFYIGHMIYNHIPLDDSSSFVNWIIKALLTIVPFILFFNAGMYLFGYGMKYITNRFLIKLKL